MVFRTKVLKSINSNIFLELTCCLGHQCNMCQVQCTFAKLGLFFALTEKWPNVRMVLTERLDLEMKRDERHFSLN